MQMLEIDAVGMLDTTAEDLGKIFVTTELGGGGTATRRDRRHRQARRRATSCVHAGILHGAPEPAAHPLARHALRRLLRLRRGRRPRSSPSSTSAPRSPPASSSPASTRPTRTGLAPVELRAGLAGLLAARHFPGLVQPGDCAAVVAVPL